MCECVCVGNLEFKVWSIFMVLNSRGWKKEWTVQLRAHTVANILFRKTPKARDETNPEHVEWRVSLHWFDRHVLF